MDLEEVNKEAVRIAERALLLSPEEGDQLIREQTAGFPAGIRILLITQSKHLAETKRALAAEHQHQLEIARQETELKKQELDMKSDQQSGDDRLKKWGFIAGIVGAVIVLGLVFATSKLTPEQWFVCRVVLALSAAGFATALAGFLHVKGNIGILAVAASGGFAVFFLTYFYNPPSLSSGGTHPAEHQAP